MRLTRKARAALGILVLAAGVLGYGVYLWHESVFVARQIESFPDPAGLPVWEVRKLALSQDFKDKVAARRMIADLPREERVRLLLVLADSAESAVRHVALVEMARLSDDARIGYVLALAAETDPDKDLREAAGKALRGR